MERVHPTFLSRDKGLLLTPPYLCLKPHLWEKELGNRKIVNLVETTWEEKEF